MSHEDRKYKIVEAGGGDLKESPVLADKSGNEIPKETKLIFNKRHHGLKKVDHHRIRFVIDDFNRSELRFAPNIADVLWVCSSTNPPSSASYMEDVFWVDNKDNDGKWVDVINMNLKEEDFFFILNFVEKTNPNGPLIPLDPPGGNENSGGPGSGLMLSGYLSTGLATGAIVGLGSIGLLNSDLVAPSPLLYGIGGALVGLLVGLLARRI